MGYMAELVGGACVLSNGPGSKLAICVGPGGHHFWHENTKNVVESFFKTKVDRFELHIHLCGAKNWACTTVAWGQRKKDRYN